NTAEDAAAPGRICAGLVTTVALLGRIPCRGAVAHRARSTEFAPLASIIQRARVACRPCLSWRSSRSKIRRAAVPDPDSRRHATQPKNSREIADAVTIRVLKRAW